MRKLVGLGLLLGVLAVGLLGLAADEPLIMGTIDRVDELSFANSWDHYSWHVLRATCDALLRFNEDTLELEAAIAERWEVNEEATVYTFYIRPGITFSDGEVCDADAVKWSLERTLRLEGPKGAVSLISNIDSIDVLDNLTVRITLATPDAIFPLVMTDQVAASLIYSPASSPADEWANGQYAGCGPYKLIEHVPDQYVRYERFEDYYGEPAKTELVIEQLYSDASSLRAGACREQRTWRTALAPNAPCRASRHCPCRRCR